MQNSTIIDYIFIGHGNFFPTTKRKKIKSLLQKASFNGKDAWRDSFPGLRLCLGQQKKNASIKPSRKGMNYSSHQKKQKNPLSSRYLKKGSDGRNGKKIPTTRLFFCPDHSIMIFFGTEQKTQTKASQSTQHSDLHTITRWEWSVFLNTKHTEGIRLSSSNSWFSRLVKGLPRSLEGDGQLICIIFSFFYCSSSASNNWGTYVSEDKKG